MTNSQHFNQSPKVKFNQFSTGIPVASHIHSHNLECWELNIETCSKSHYITNHLSVKSAFNSKFSSDRLMRHTKTINNRKKTRKTSVIALKKKGGKRWGMKKKKKKKN